MKKILIITYYYKHKNAMASVRAIKLAKFFAAQGNDVTVLTSNQKDTWTKDYLEPIPDERVKEIYAPEVKRWTSIGKYLNHRKQLGTVKMQAVQNEAADKEQKAEASSQKPGFKAKLRAYLGWLFYFNVAKQEDICMFKGLKAEFKKRSLGSFDTVIATYPNYGAFLTGMWIKKHGYCKQLIADFRDPLYNPGFRDKQKEADYDMKCLHSIMKAADKAVCVSQGIADGIAQQLPEQAYKLHVIPNGFDPEDVETALETVDFDKSKINFVYTGTLYHGKRCVDMLAQVLAEMCEQGIIKPDDFSFEYAGPDFEELVAQLRGYGLESSAVDHGFVSRAQAIAMQKAADALLLLTWNESNYQGVVPGKLYEYMAIGTAPIIALITGDVVESEVALKIKETSSGIACEQANGVEDKEKLKAFIMPLFEKNFVFSSNVQKYNYEIISKDYIQLMLGGQEK